MKYQKIENQNEKLREICEKNLEIKYKYIDSKLIEILNYELKCIEDLNFAYIFLAIYEAFKK